METIVLLQLITAISTAVIAVCGVFAAYYWGYLPRKRKEKIEELQKELFDCYCDISTLLEIEQDYMDDAGVGKKTVRKNRSLSSRCEPARLTKRLDELRQLTSK